MRLLLRVYAMRRVTLCVANSLKLSTAYSIFLGAPLHIGDPGLLGDTRLILAPCERARAAAFLDPLKLYGLGAVNSGRNVGPAAPWRRTQAAQ
jgi:hypothetical protein